MWVGRITEYYLTFLFLRGIQGTLFVIRNMRCIGGGVQQPRTISPQYIGRQKGQISIKNISIDNLISYHVSQNEYVISIGGNLKRDTSLGGLRSTNSSSLLFILCTGVFHVKPYAEGHFRLFQGRKGSYLDNLKVGLDLFCSRLDMI